LLFSYEFSDALQIFSTALQHPVGLPTVEHVFIVFFSDICQNFLGGLFPRALASESALRYDRVPFPRHV